MSPIAVALILLTPPVSKPVEPAFTPAQQNHWSFTAPKKAPVPPTQLAVKSAIDAFVLQKLEAAKLTLNRPADPLSLIRRLYLDVTGLPPTPQEIDLFLADKSPDAYEKLVDRLLASPHFGERWAQHWLDIVRYAETNGYELDAERHDAWRYRDYVVRSLNEDKPYSQFLREQIAGDLLAKGKPPAEVADLLIATGMHRCGPVHVVGGNLNKDVLRQERLTEMVNGLGASVMGLTLGCARCHDHKFDPISQADYFRTQAFFASAEYHDYPLSTKEQRDAHTDLVNKAHAKMAPFQKQISELEASYRVKLRAQKIAELPAELRKAMETPAAKRTEEQKKFAKDAETLVRLSWDEVVDALSPADRAKREKIRAQIHAITKTIPSSPAVAWAVESSATVPPTYVLKRGDATKKTDMVPPGFLKIISKQKSESLSRIDLADWLTKPDHPLTSRVIVNRLWHHYFGKGIVGTINDFGLRGDPPSNQQLLDYLAVQLVEGGWKLKAIHRMILTSATYRQSSDQTLQADGPRIDPENKLLWRMNRKRLEAEAIRDAVLTASGALNRQVGGLSIRVPLEPEVYDLIFTEAEPDDLWHVTEDPKQFGRRSIYLFAKRNVRLPMLEAFDQPDTLSPCNGRSTSTFAPQALILMNGPFNQEQSRVMMASLKTGSIDEIYRRTLGRLPSDKERAVAERFLQEQSETIRARLLARRPVLVPDHARTDMDLADQAALADLCLALFNTNEFVYVP